MFDEKKKITRRDFLKMASAAVICLYSSESSSMGSDEKITITAVGDVNLGYHFPPEQMCDYDYPFKNVKNIFMDSGISFANLEFVLTNTEQKMPKQFNFRGNPEYARCLKEGGIKIVSLANNHSMDYGECGLKDTISSLEKYKIKYAGAGKNLAEARKPAIFDTNGKRIAFLAYSLIGPGFARQTTHGIAYADEKHIYEDVKKAKNEAENVIVSFHWGKEYSHYPTKRQRALAHYTISHGADMVLGHHPHVLQGIEEYKHGLIAYSLGNFVFGGNKNPNNKDSIILKVHIGKTIEDYNIIPVKITSKDAPFQPYILDSKQKENVIEKIKLYSKF